MRYIDLMGGVKPHLLTKSKNNLGAQTVVTYAPSTRFYLQDRSAGKPWVTRLPFVVHVVERVETRDLVSGNRFVARHAYHHGHFDGEERESRDFQPSRARVYCAGRFRRDGVRRVRLQGQSLE